MPSPWECTWNPCRVHLYLPPNLKIKPWISTRGFLQRNKVLWISKAHRSAPWSSNPTPAREKAGVFHKGSWRSDAWKPFNYCSTTFESVSLVLNPVSCSLESRIGGNPQTLKEYHLQKSLTNLVSRREMEGCSRLKPPQIIIAMEFWSFIEYVAIKTLHSKLQGILHCHVWLPKGTSSPNPATLRGGHPPSPLMLFPLVPWINHTLVPNYSSGGYSLNHDTPTC